MRLGCAHTMGLGRVHKYTFYIAHFSKRTLLKGGGGGGGGVPSESLSIKLPNVYIEYFSKHTLSPK